MTKSTGARTTQSHPTTSSQAESKLEGFAEDLGRLLGEAHNKAAGWLAQRDAIAKHLEGVRDSANHLLQQLGMSSPTLHHREEGKRGPGRQKTAGAAPRKRKFTMSAEAREKIAAAQRARWAKQKAGKK